MTRNICLLFVLVITVNGCSNGDIDARVEPYSLSDISGRYRGKIYIVNSDAEGPMNQFLRKSAGEIIILENGDCEIKSFHHGSMMYTWRGSIRNIRTEKDRNDYGEAFGPAMHYFDWYFSNGDDIRLLHCDEQA